MNPVSEFVLGNTVVRYRHDAASGRVGLELVPVAARGREVARRATLRGLPYIDAIPGNDPCPAAPVDSLVQLKLVGDPYTAGFAQGHTMRQSPSVDGFQFLAREVTECGEGEGGGTVITTRLRRVDGCEVEHRLVWRGGGAAGGGAESAGGAAGGESTGRGKHGAGGQAFEVTTTFSNHSEVPVTLEMLASFSLGGITPFAADDAPGRLRVHRFRSAWSAEGRLESRSVEELHLERSWSGAGAFSERFGQVGTMPVRRWFPFVAVEDTEAGVLWGAQLAWAGSWQLEVFRQHDDVALSGGLADREFGHWTKVVEPGETLTTPPAWIACVAGDLDALCDRLTAMQERAADVAQPEVERDLPIVVNEWCTTWGDPSHEKISALAQRLAGSDVRYLVIDAGWYKTERGDWGNGHGDWEPSAKLFPHGLTATAAMIRSHGLVPGLWFEMETVGDASEAFSLTDLLLHRDGQPVTVRHRRFWDLGNPRAVEHLSGRVIDLLERCGFGYLKVDYNETLGLGCENDGAESLGEGLRRQVEGVHAFFERIRTRLPDLVIENCSSGGHRLEPSMLGRTAMSSFSDAHELVEIPIIAANLHRLMLPRQSQIWAVLHATDSDERLRYSLAATFLGRMCLSGGIDGLSRQQWAIVERAMALYRRAAPVIARGRSRWVGELGASWRHPRGWQAVARVAEDGRTALVVVHGFAGAPRRVEVGPALARVLAAAGPGSGGAGERVAAEGAAEWRVVETLSAGAASGVASSAAGAAAAAAAWPAVELRGDFTAEVLWLERDR